MPSLITLLILPILIGLGVWQLQRMQWKNHLLADLVAAEAQPSLSIGMAPIPDQAAFRHLQLTLDCPLQNPQGEAGRNLDGKPGWAFFLSCRHGSQAVQLVTGWHEQADGWKQAAIPHGIMAVSGLAVPASRDDWRLIPADAPAPLKPVAEPTPADIPNNHLAYAVQWFAFAAVLLIIYGITCYRWRLASGGDSE